MSGRFAVIAGGGTAGHVHPGIGVARALVERGHRPESILYVGSDRGIEQQLVPAAGFELVTLSGKGIPRRDPVGAALAVASLTRGAGEAARLLRREQPRVVLSLGGFAAAPCAFAARALRIPVVVHEQNAVAGAANRAIARWAVASAVSFPGTELPRAVVTGNPVRPEMVAADRANRKAARQALGMSDDARVIAVTGGSLGSLRINEAIVEALAVWGARDDTPIVVHHVIGNRDFDLIEPRARAAAGAVDYRPVRYEDAMPTVFEACDVVISRAGASTTAELAVVGVPSVLVPLPTAPGDHQTRNARALVEAGAAVLVPDGECRGDRLVREIDALFVDDGRLDTMHDGAQAVGRVDAADRVAQLLEEHAR